MSALQARYASTFREVALRPSIAACLRASLLRAKDLQELQAALEREYGSIQGRRAFQHLTELFQAAAKQPAQTDRTTPPAQPEQAPVKRSRSRRRKSPQEGAKAAAQPKAPESQSAAQPKVPEPQPPHLRRRSLPRRKNRKKPPKSAAPGGAAGDKSGRFRRKTDFIKQGGGGQTVPRLPVKLKPGHPLRACGRSGPEFCWYSPIRCHTRQSALQNCRPA